MGLSKKGKLARNHISRELSKSLSRGNIQNLLKGDFDSFIHDFQKSFSKSNSKYNTKHYRQIAKQTVSNFFNRYDSDNDTQYDKRRVENSVDNFNKFDKKEKARQIKEGAKIKSGTTLLVEGNYWFLKDYLNPFDAVGNIADNDRASIEIDIMGNKFKFPDINEASFNYPKISAMFKDLDSGQTLKVFRKLSKGGNIFKYVIS